MRAKIAYLVFFISIMSFGQEKTKGKDVFDVARSGTVDEMKALIQKKTDTINATNTMGFTPLILACYRGNTDVAVYLVDKVKDLNYSSSSGTALSAAVVKGNLFLANILLENKANPDIADQNGLTPLIYAIQFKNKELVALLLKFKANKKLPDATGKMPFEYAVFTKDQEIINLIKN